MNYEYIILTSCSLKVYHAETLMSFVSWLFWDAVRPLCTFYV